MEEAEASFDGGDEGAQRPLPQEGYHYRSYQTTKTEVIRTEGIITKCTGEKNKPYQITCTKSDVRGYVGKTVAATAKQLGMRTTKIKNRPTQEENTMANCTVHTDFGELGTHKGYVADVGYDSGEEETQIGIIPLTIYSLKTLFILSSGRSLLYQTLYAN